MRQSLDHMTFQASIPYDPCRTGGLSLTLERLEAAQSPTTHKKHASRLPLPTVFAKLALWYKRTAMSCGLTVTLIIRKRCRAYSEVDNVESSFLNVTYKLPLSYE